MLYAIHFSVGFVTFLLCYGWDDLVANTFRGLLFVSSANNLFNNIGQQQQKLGL